MSSITASLTTARVAPATRAASKGKRATKAAAVSEKKAGAAQEEANDVFGVARKAATAAFAAAVLATTQPGVALASGGSILDAIPPAPSNGPLRNLPRELTEPDEIFREDFTVEFAGLEVDHKYLVSALVLGQAIGFVGALVGGNEARKKGAQVAALNQSLLKVNSELRREMREAGMGPYVPIPAQRFIEKGPGQSSDEEIAVVDGIVLKLKAAKRHLKESANDLALGEFDDALQSIDANENALAEGWKAARKAHRGRGAALERLGRFAEALDAMQTVLSLSVDHDDHSGETDALGVIADIYTDMDQLEVASEYYDRYFKSLQEEDALNAAKDAQEADTAVAA